MAPSYKLTYFQTRGAAEPIRFLLSYGGIDFEDVRVSREQWPALKEQTPFGFLPMLEHDGKKADQSIAIARYVAKQVKLVGNDDWEDLEIDAIVDAIKEGSLNLRLSRLRAEADEEKKKVLKEHLIGEILPNLLKRFENVAQKNNGYMALGRLTWADLYFVSLLPGLDFYAGYDIIKDYPNLAALRSRVLNIPGIKKWVENRPKSDF